MTFLSNIKTAAELVEWMESHRNPSASVDADVHMAAAQIMERLEKRIEALESK